MLHYDGVISRTKTNIMIALIIGLSAVLFYLTSAWTQNRTPAQQASKRAYALSLVAWLLQGLHLYLGLFTEVGLLLDLGATLSLTTWAVIGVILISSLRNPVANLLIFAAPATAAAIVIDILSVPAFQGRQFSLGIWVGVNLSATDSCGSVVCFQLVLSFACCITVAISRLPVTAVGGL